MSQAKLGSKDGSRHASMQPPRQVAGAAAQDKEVRDRAGQTPCALCFFFFFFSHNAPALNTRQSTPARQANGGNGGNAIVAPSAKAVGRVRRPRGGTEQPSTIGNKKNKSKKQGCQHRRCPAPPPAFASNHPARHWPHHGSTTRRVAAAGRGPGGCFPTTTF